jgi:hypothetical protein
MSEHNRMLHCPQPFNNHPSFFKIFLTQDVAGDSEEVVTVEIRFGLTRADCLIGNAHTSIELICSLLPG